jgi:hypothetical protein
MFDIFADFKPQPKLYIADVTVSFSYKPRKNSKTVERHTVTLEKVPIVLNGREFPTKKTEEHFMKRVFDKHGKGKFDDSNMRLVKIDNCKYSSDLAYKFDYDKH